MMIKNFLSLPYVKKNIHNGKGMVDNVKLFGEDDFETGLRYISFTSIPPGASKGFHDHDIEREEVYVVLGGTGIYTENGDQKHVVKGDVIVTKAGVGHGIENDSAESLDIFIFWVKLIPAYDNA